MATAQSDENPLPINVVPMVDVIFCLCVFFLSSFRSRIDEARIDTWLPKDRGPGATSPGAPLSELRVVLECRPGSSQVRWRFLHHDLAGPRELEPLLREAHDELVARSQPERPLILDAQPGVPWSAAMQVVDLGRELGIPELQFALGPAERP